MAPLLSPVLPSRNPCFLFCPSLHLSSCRLTLLLPLTVGVPAFPISSRLEVASEAAKLAPDKILLVRLLRHWHIYTENPLILAKLRRDWQSWRKERLSEHLENLFSWILTTTDGPFFYKGERGQRVQFRCRLGSVSLGRGDLHLPSKYLFLSMTIMSIQATCSEYVFQPTFLI